MRGHPPELDWLRAEYENGVSSIVSRLDQAAGGPGAWRRNVYPSVRPSRGCFIAGDGIVHHIADPTAGSASAGPAMAGARFTGCDSAAVGRLAAAERFAISSSTATGANSFHAIVLAADARAKVGHHSSERLQDPRIFHDDSGEPGKRIRADSQSAFTINAPGSHSGAGQRDAAAGRATFPAAICRGVATPAAKGADPRGGISPGIINPKIK